MATFAGKSFTCVLKDTISKTIALVVSERLREISDVDSVIRNVQFEPSKVSTDHSKAVPLLQFFFVCELVVSYIYIYGVCFVIICSSLSRLLLVPIREYCALLLLISPLLCFK